MTRHWRWLFAVALLVGAAVPFVLGGQQVLARLVTVPVGWLALLVAMIAVCWNLNAWRLRLMLNGRAPGLGHGAAVATVMATEFTLNATPGGSGAPFTLAALLRRRGLEETLAVPRRRLLLMFSLCLCHWLLRYSVIYVAVLALGEHLDWVYGFFVQMVAMGAGHLTLLPGGAGGAEVAGAALLNPWLTSVTTATTIVVWRFFTFYWYLLAGGAVMLWLAARTGQPLLDGK